MSELCTLAASIVLQSQSAEPPIHEACPQPAIALSSDNPASSPEITYTAGLARNAIAPEPQTLAASLARLEFSLHDRERPRSTAQLFQQRWEALRNGQTYTRLPINSFADKWRGVSHQPTYEEWLELLNREAWSMSRGQGNNPLTIMVGDSLSMWMPTEFMSSNQFWLNQSVSGETAAAMVKRLYLFKDTHPNVIHVMAGINDLKNGASDRDVLIAMQSLMQNLRQQHPHARIIVHSILPTRLPNLPSDRIRTLNRYIAYIANQQGTDFLDLQHHFIDSQGNLRQDLTTDGLHLNYQGYALWQSLIRQIGSVV